MKNHEVIVKWLRGLPAQSGNLRTDGITLWSYRMPIARVYPIARVIRVIDRSLSPSQTTSRHRTLAAGEAAVTGFRVDIVGETDGLVPSA